MKDEKLTPAELAALWEITETTLSQWRWTGRGPKFQKIGRQVKYRIRDIELFEEQQVRSNTADHGPFSMKPIKTNKKED